MRQIEVLRTRLDAFWREADLTYSDYCKGLPPRAEKLIRCSAEWEEELDAFPKLSLFEQACRDYFDSGSNEDLDVLVEAIAIDLEDGNFIHHLLASGLRTEEVWNRLRSEVVLHVRYQFIWLLRDMEGAVAVETLHRLRSEDDRPQVLEQLDGILDFREGRLD